MEYMQNYVTYLITSIYKISHANSMSIVIQKSNFVRVILL